MTARRLVVVSHPAVLPVNQEVYAELVTRGWDVQLVVPDRWRHEYREGSFPPVAHPALAGRLHPQRIVYAGAPQRHAYLTRPSHMLRRLRPDVVFLEQECFSVSARQWGAAAARLGVPFGIQAAENMDRPLPAPARRIRDWVLARAAFVAARSPAAADIVRRWGSTAPAEVVPHHVPPWPVGSNDRPVDRPAALTDVFTVGYAGRLVEQKGLDVLVEAVRRLGAGTRLLVAGDGPLRSWLEQADLGGATLDLRTTIDHGEMGGVYAEMDVLALPSRTTPTWTEQFGRVLVEAMWCDVPVVGSDSGEIPWVISTTGGGLVVPEGDATALHDALDRLRADPDLRTRLAAAGRASVEATYSVPAVADRFEQLLATVDASRDQRTHVALVAHGVHDGGGMERATAELIHHLHDRHRFTVVSAELGLELRPLVDRWVRVRVPMRPIPLKFALFWACAGRALRRIDADVVHTVGAIVPNRADLSSIHYCNAAARLHAGTARSRLRRWNTGAARFLAVRAERWSYRPARLGRWVAVSAGVAAEMHEHYPATDGEVVPNGVDTERFRPDAASRDATRHETGDGDAVVALFVGGDWHRKGLDLAIAAVGAARAGGHDVVLWVVGDGDVDEATATARAAGTQDAVRFLGRRSDTERWYAGADLLVLPTTYEASPLVLLEAAASGLPVIVTPVHTWFGDAAEEAGAVVVPRDVSDVAAALAGLATDPERRARLGAQARTTAAAFTWRRTADEYARLYDAAVQQNVQQAATLRATNATAACDAAGR